MGESVFKLACPCCGAALEIDAEARVILSHKAPKPAAIPTDLREAVQKLKKEEHGRDERFRQQVEAEREHEKILAKRFEGLLKKARSEGPVKPGPRDIDLD